MITYLTPIIVGLAVLGVVTGIRVLAIGAVELAYGLARWASTSSGKRATAGGSEGDARRFRVPGIWADEWS